MDNETEHLSRRQRQRRNQLTSDLAHLLGTGQGQRFLRWLIDRSGLFLSANAVSYDAGRREMGLELVNAMNEADPYGFVKLMQEGANELVEARAAAKKGNPNEFE